VNSFVLEIVPDTVDLNGKIICKKSVSNINLRKAIKAFKGEIFKIPPNVFNVKNNAVKLYELARQGVEVERSPGKVVRVRIEKENTQVELI
jgi:tRNA pseudouridine55 synthase